MSHEESKINELLLESDDAFDIADEDQFAAYVKSLETINPSTQEGIIRQIGALDNDLLTHTLLSVYVDELISRDIIDKKNKKDYTKNLKDQLKVLKTGSPILSDSPLSIFMPGHPLKADLMIPQEYILDQKDGITKIVYKGSQIQRVAVSPYIILPYEIVEDRYDISGSKLVRLIKWDHDDTKWIFHPEPVPINKLVMSSEIGILNKGGVIALDDDQRRLFSLFFAAIINRNKMLRGLGINEAIRSCGWTKGGLFFPFTTKDKGDDLMFLCEAGTTNESIFKIADELPRGKIEKAREVLEEMKDNSVFAIIMAGCLASPLLPKLKGTLDENIGIDIYGKTTSGKTTVETLATNLVYGLGDELKMSWAGATMSGIWLHAEAVNNLPLILDDTHRMEEKMTGVPHDLMNRKQGNKSVQTANGKWAAKDSTSDRYTGVILFNGEIGISTRTPDDSAGIYGRVIMVKEKPFPDHYNSFIVEDLKRTSRLNGGHFAEPWIRFLETVDENDLNDEIRVIGTVLHKDDADALYGRLVTKASLLIWSLRKFNEMFGTNINEEAMIKTLQKCMAAETENVNVSDKIADSIITSVFSRIANIEPNANGYIVADYFNKNPEIEDVSFGGSVNIVYKDKQYLIITDDVFRYIMGSMGRAKPESDRAILHNSGYIKDTKITAYSRPKMNGDKAEKPRIFGIRFEYGTCAKFIERLMEKMQELPVE
jgi:hypothetical protein